MASRQRRPGSTSASSRRGIMRPIISSDVMGNRNVEIVPVGAWVEPANSESQVDAVLAAQIEEEKISRMKEEKENQLRSFQREVKKRVDRAREIKRQHQIQEAEKAFEMERRVVLQSFQTGGTRKDTCSMRQDFDHAIRKRLLEKYGEDVSDWGSEKYQDLGNQLEENHHVTDHARQQLSSKQIAQSCTKVSDQRQFGTATRDIQNPSVRTLVDVNALPKGGADNLNENGLEHSKNLGEQQDESNEINENENYGSEHECESQKDKPAVRFSEKEHKVVSRRRKNKSAPAKRPSSAKLASLLSQFKEGEVLEQQKKQQAAISRRIFMDREREAVRENIRRQQHRLKIVELKKEKEAYRKELEELVQQQLEPVDPITGETEAERELREHMEEMRVQEMVNRKNDEIRRNREMERYLDALRHNLIEKARRQRVELPSLCACGDNVWDTHPETCANNCFFYKNHRAYARALQSLLSSVEVM